LRALDRMHDFTKGARVTGTILLDGQDICAPDADPVAIRHRIGMVFQRPRPWGFRVASSSGCASRAF
jgi:phosphate transport system ATP-binding protein